MKDNTEIEEKCKKVVDDLEDKLEILIDENTNLNNFLS